MYNKIYFQSGPNGNAPGWRAFVEEMNRNGRFVTAAVTDTMSLLDDMQEMGRRYGVVNRGNFRPTGYIDAGEMKKLDPNWEEAWGSYHLAVPVYNIYGSKEAAELTYARAASLHVRAVLTRVPAALDRQMVTVSTWNEIRPYVGWGSAETPDSDDWKKKIPGYAGWADAIGRQAWHIGRELIRRKDAGEPWFRWAAFAYAGGNPEDGTWEAPGMLDYLRLCAERPDVLGICLHEYSFTLDVWRDFGDRAFIGRFERLFAVCDKHGIKRPWIEIKEWGWEERDIPDQATALRQIAECAEYYALYPEIRLAAIWTANGGWGKASRKVPALPSGLYEFALSAKGVFDSPDEPEPPTPPAPQPPPPTQQPVVVDINGSFEGGWSDLPPAPGNLTNQKPTGWALSWVPIGEQIYGRVRKNGKPLICQGVPECIHKKAGQLPSYERPGGSDPLILDGDHVYKIFHFGSVWGAELRRTVMGFVPGQEVRLTTPLRAHLHNVWNEPDDVEVDIILNGETTTLLAEELGHRQWGHYETMGAADANGRLTIALRFIARWAHPRDFFMDGWKLEALPVAEAPPPDPQRPLPAKIKHTTHLLPQTYSEAEFTAVVQHLEPQKTTVTHSHDAAYAIAYAGTAESEVVGWDADRWGFDVAAWFAERDVLFGQRSVAELLPPPAPADPLHGLRLGRILSKPYVMTSAFNAPRTYNGKPEKHEGVDFDVTEAVADSKASVLAVISGIVTAVYRRAGGYGLRVIVKSFHNGIELVSWYGHLDQAYVSPGQQVALGQRLGEVGTSGNVTGEHVHYTLQAIGHGLSGYVLPDVVDSTPYFDHNQPLPPTSQGRDMAVYFLPPNGRQYGDIYMLKNSWSGGSERVQVQRHGGDSFVVKNQQFEQRQIDNQYIRLVADTSPGDGQYYTVKGVWMPRFWHVGDSFTRTETVSWFWKRDCSPVAEKPTGTYTSQLKFVQHWREWVAPHSGIVLQDVVKLQWEINGRVDEEYFFANGLGLVRWRKYDGRESWIHELIPAGSQGNNVMEELGCL